MTLRLLCWHGTLLTAAACLVFSGCTDEGDSTAPAGCGVVPCTASDLDGVGFDVDNVGLDPQLGKSDAADRVATAIVDATRDGVLDLADVDVIYEAAGNKISSGELRAIRDGLAADRAYTIDDDALAEARFRAWTANLSDVETDFLRDGYSFGGTELPAAVIDAVVDARLNGAVAYDVNERDDDNEGIWSPYPATTPASHNMAWDYTEVTPAALAADLADNAVEYNAIVGTETATLPDGREYKRARYEVRKGGTGNVLSHYDEVYHPDIYARGSQGQIWANNVAILADGSFHCLPAARRSIRQDLILTNPSLSRGAFMLYNGHLDIRGGVVEGIEMSGRLSKMAAKGKAIFIDPVPLLEAWGFDISPNVRLRYGNTGSGTPVQMDGVIQEAPADSTTN